MNDGAWLHTAGGTERLSKNRMNEAATEDLSERFYRLVWPERAVVYRLARILLGEGPAADDLVQEGMLKAFKSIAQFREGTDVRAWLRTIVRNARVDQLRVEKSRPTVSLDADLLDIVSAEEPGRPDGALDEPEALLEAFSDQGVIDALQRLPEEIRWTLLLVDVEQVDHAEAAEVLGVPVGTVKSRTSRGRAMLRSTLLPVARDRRVIR